jgi:hypothetical protein
MYPDRGTATQALHDRSEERIKCRNRRRNAAIGNWEREILDAATSAKAWLRTDLQLGNFGRLKK